MQTPDTFGTSGDARPIDRRAASAVRSQQWLAAGHLVRLLLAVAVLVMLGRHLEAGAFGQFALVSLMFLLLQELLDLGTASAVVRAVAAAPECEPELLAALLAWRRCLSVSAALAWWCVIATRAALGYVVPPAPVAVLVGVALALSCLNAYHVAFQVRQAFGRAVRLGLGVQLAFAAGCAFVVDQPSAGTWVLVLVALREIAQVLMSRGVARRFGAVPHALRWRAPSVVALIGGVATLGAATLLYKLSFHAGALMLWALAADTEVGRFSAAHRLLAPALELAMGFAAPLLTWLVLCTASERAQVLRGHAGFMAGAAALLAVAGWACAPSLLHALYGARWGAGDDSVVPILRCLSVAVACAAVNQVLAVGLMAARRDRELLLGALLALAAQIVVGGWRVGHDGALGAAQSLWAAESVLMLWLWGCLGLGAHPRAVLAALLPAAMLAAMLAVPVGHEAWPWAVAAVGVPAGMAWLWRRPMLSACREVSTRHVGVVTS